MTGQTSESRPGVPELGEQDLYVHVADDGGVAVVDRDRSRPVWITTGELADRLTTVSGAGGVVWLSTGNGSSVATPVVTAIEATPATVRRCRPMPETLRHQGFTTLMSAARSGASAVVDDLLAGGARVDVRDDRGRTALSYAANTGQTEIVQRLLEAGADPESYDQEGDTALLVAATWGHGATVRALLDAGANPYHARADGRNARDLAGSNGHPAVAAMLPERTEAASPNARVFAMGRSAPPVVLVIVCGVVLIGLPVLGGIAGLVHGEGRDVLIGAVFTLVSIGFTVLLYQALARQRLVIDGHRLWVRIVRMRGPIEFRQVVAVHWWPTQSGWSLVLVQPVAGRRVGVRSAIFTEGVVRARRYPEALAGRLRYVTLAPWMLAGGAQELLAPLVRRATVPAQRAARAARAARRSRPAA